MKNIKKRLITLMLVISILLSLPMPAFAQEEVQIVPPTISPWASGEVLQGQYMGIVGLDNEIMGVDFTQEITKDQLKDLAQKSNVKISQATGSELGELSYEPLGVTRGEVLNYVFYTIEGSLGDLGDPISYLKENNILRGYLDNESHLEKMASYEESILFFVRAIDHIYRTKDLGAKGVFYKLENKDNTVYLLGSIHVGNYGFYPLNPILTDAYGEAEKLFLELDITDPDIISKVLQVQFRTEDEPSLQEEVGDELYMQIQAIAEDRSLPVEVFDIIKTKYIPQTISSLLMDPAASSLGIDMYFAANANLQDMEIGSIEEVETQIDILSKAAGETEEEIIASIEEAIDLYNSEEKRAEYKGQIAKLQKLWAENDEENLYKALEIDSSNPLLKDRDPQMAEYIKNLLEDESGNTYYVIVGAAHLLSDQSVLDYLEDYGYTSENMY